MQEIRLVRSRRRSLGGAPRHTVHIRYPSRESWLVDGAAIRFRSAVSCGLLSTSRSAERTMSGMRPDRRDFVRCHSDGEGRRPGEIALSRSAMECVSGHCQWVLASEGTARLQRRELAPTWRRPLRPVTSLFSILAAKLYSVLLSGRRRPACSRLGEVPDAFTVAYMMLRHPGTPSDEILLRPYRTPYDFSLVSSGLKAGSTKFWPRSEIIFIAVFGLPPWCSTKTMRLAPCGPP